MHYQNSKCSKLSHWPPSKWSKWSKTQVTIFWPDNLLESAENQKELSICGELLSEKISIFGLSYLRPSQNTHTSLVFSAMLWACSHICHGWNLYAKWDNMTCIGYIITYLLLAFFTGKMVKSTLHFWSLSFYLGGQSCSGRMPKKKGKKQNDPWKKLPSLLFLSRSISNVIYGLFPRLFGRSHRLKRGYTKIWWYTI